MTVTRLVWIVVAVLVVVSAFVGGVAVGNWNVRRVAFAGYGVGSGMMRSLAPSGVFTPTVPNTLAMPFGYGRGYGMAPRNGRNYSIPPSYGCGSRMAPGYGRGNGMLPNARGGRNQMPGNRGTTKPDDRSAPDRGRGWRR